MQLKKFVTPLILAILLFNITNIANLYASSLAKGIEEMFSSLGASSNFSESGSFRDQASGHYAGGGLVVKNKNQALQLIHVQLPYAGGMNCGDFNLNFGGFSFVNSQALVEMLQRVGRGVPVYALQLALKTFAPQVLGTMESILGKLMAVNKLFLDDCRAKQRIMDAVLPKQGALRETLCKEHKGMGDSEDAFGGWSDCDTPKKRNKVIDTGKKDKYKDLMVGEYNLVWHVLQKMPRYKNNKSLAEFVMTLTGTVLSFKKGDTYKLLHVEPKGDSASFLAAQLKGGETRVLRCKEKEKCLKVEYVRTTVKPKDSLGRKVLQRINRLKKGYSVYGDDNPVKAEDLEFLKAAAGVPVYRYLQVSVAANAEDIVGLSNAAELIAMSVLMNHFERAMTEIMAALSLLESVNVEPTIIEKFKHRLHQARISIQVLMGKQNFKGIAAITRWVKAHELSIRALD